MKEIVLTKKKYYQNDPQFYGVYSRSTLPKITDGAYVINLDVYKSIGTHRITLYVNGDNGSESYNATYFDRFVVKLISKEIKKFIGNKSMITKYLQNTSVQILWYWIY